MEVRGSQRRPRARSHRSGGLVRRGQSSRQPPEVSMASWMRLAPADLSSVEYDGLDLAAYGLLMWMAWRSWDQGGLPDDPAVLRRALRGRIDGGAFDEAWRQVRPLLDADSDGRLRIPWLEHAREEAITHLKTDADRKREARKRARPVDVRRTSVDIQGHPRTSASVQESPSTDVRTDAPTDGQQAAPPPAVKPKRAEAEGPHADFRRWWCEAFEKQTRNPYAWDYGKDSKLVSALLKRASLEEIQKRATRLLRAPPDWLVEGGVDIGTLSSQFNKLAAMGALTPTNGVREAAIRAAAPPATEAPLFLPPPTRKRA